MIHTFDREERRNQKEMLKSKYPDYDAKRHGVFVDRYNKEIDAERLQQYMDEYGILN